MQARVFARTEDSPGACSQSQWRPTSSAGCSGDVQYVNPLLALYARPYDPREPVICLDEKSKQLLRETRRPLPAKPGTPAKADYEYGRAGRHEQHLCRCRASRSAAARTGHRSAYQRRLRWFRLPTAAPGLFPGAQGSTGTGQPQHSFEQQLRGSARCKDRCDTAAQDPVPLHADPCQLVEHGRDRDRHPAAPVPGTLCCRARHPRHRGDGLAEATQRSSMWHRVDLYPSRRRSKVESPLCFVINVS
jgi:hypothetical protein